MRCDTKFWLTLTFRLILPPWGGREEGLRPQPKKVGPTIGVGQYFHVHQKRRFILFPRIGRFKIKTSTLGRKCNNVKIWPLTPLYLYPFDSNIKINRQIEICAPKNVENEVRHELLADFDLSPSRILTPLTPILESNTKSKPTPLKS